MEDPWLIRLGKELRSAAPEASHSGDNQVASSMKELEEHIGNATHHIASWAVDIQGTVRYRFWPFNFI